MRSRDLLLRFHAQAGRSQVGSPRAEARAAADKVRRLASLGVDDDHRVVGLWAAIGKAALVLPAGLVRALPIESALAFVRDASVDDVVAAVSETLEGPAPDLRRPEDRIAACAGIVVALVDHRGLADYIAAALHDDEQPESEPGPDLRRRYPEVKPVGGEECVNLAGLLRLLYDNTREGAAPPATKDPRTRGLLRRFGERATAAVEAERLLSGLADLGAARTQEVLNRTFRLEAAERRIKNGDTFERILEVFVGDGATS